MSSPIEILLVEDNQGDVDLIRESLEEAGVPSKLNTVANGGEALAFLRKQGKYSEAGQPNVVLLDLNLPVKDGLATLKEMKADPDLKRIPVIVLTTSNRIDDVDHCYALHANCYVIKPMKFAQYVQLMKGIRDFWFSLVTLPSKA